MPYPPGYQRKGVVLTYQFDPDAVAMLRELAPTKKAHGRYLSELVRRDYIRRQDWERMQAAHQAALVDVALIGDEALEQDHA